MQLLDQWRTTYICGAHIFLCMIVVWMVLHIRPIQPVIWCFRDSHYCCWMGLSAITDEIAGNNIYQINQGKGRNKEELRHTTTTHLPDTVRDIARIYHWRTVTMITCSVGAGNNSSTRHCYYLYHRFASRITTDQQWRIILILKWTTFLPHIMLLHISQPNIRLFYLMLFYQTSIDLCEIQIQHSVVFPSSTWRSLLYTYNMNIPRSVKVTPAITLLPTLANIINVHKNGIKHHSVHFSPCWL